jgi:hypothetical protein
MIRCECQCVCCDTQVFVLPDTSGLASLRCPSCGRDLVAQRIDPFGENDWWTCNDPVLMTSCRPNWPSDRKCRLFACACCRLVWSGLSLQARDAVELAERLADGLADPAEIVRTRKRLRAAAVQDGSRPALHEAAARALDDSPSPVAVARSLRRWFGGIDAQRGALFRDIAGNPFRPSPPLPPVVLAWNDGTVRRIARGIYEDRAFDRLPILADALEEAGCTDGEILAHCRSPGPHVRGCWPVDLALCFP